MQKISPDDFLVFEATPGKRVIFLPDVPAFTIIATSQDMRQFVGRTKEQMIGKSVFDAFPANPDDPDPTGHNNLRLSLEYVIRHKTSHQMESQRYDIAGEGGKFREIYWQNTSTPVLNEKGEVIYIIHTAEDITEKVKASELRERIKGLEQAHHLFLQAPAVIGITRGEDHVLVLANDAALQLWNKTPDILGKPLLEGIPEFAGQVAFEKIDSVYKTGISYRATEMEIKSIQNGKEVVGYFDVYYQPYYEEGCATVSGVFTLSNDVTEKVLGKRKIEESEARFRTLFETMDQGFSIIEMIFDEEDKPVDSLFLEMNAVFEKQSGFKGAVGKKIRDIVPEIEDKWFEVYGKVALTGEPIRFTDGSEVLGRWFDIYAFPAGDVGSRQVAVLFTDITERVLSRQKIEASQRNLLTLFEEARVGIATLSADDRLVYETANLFYSELVGRQPRELIGNPMMEALPELKGQGFDDLLKEVISRGEAYIANEVEVHLMRDGRMETIYVNLTYQPRKEADAVSGVLVIATDVTEQVRSRKKIEQNEKQLETALEQVRLSKEAAELGTFDMNLEKGTMHWDDRCRTLFGISHHQPVTYEKDFVGGLHPDDKERILRVIDQLFIKSLSNGDYDVEYRTVGAEDGIIRWVRAKGKVYFDARKKPVRFIGSVLDITEKVMAIQKIEGLVEERTKELAQVNQNLLHANKELQRSNANLEEFAHAASHDLKEPIRKIHFFTHQLKDQLESQLKENEKRSFSRIVNATQRMRILIDDLLLYSHVSQRPLEKEGVDLNIKLQRVLEDLELDIEEKKAVVQVGNLPVIVGYRRQLQQLFQNLLSNSLKYSKADIAPRIEITSEQIISNGKPYHLIKVSDNGIGFDQKYTDKIFQMFSRLHGKTEYSGTGVGLSIVKKVVENHNGFIKVESAVGEGSTFEIYLPV